jgi:hypothetical protein
MNINIVAGDKALELFDDITFIERWDYIYEKCHWATIYQSSVHARIWFDNYSVNYEPIFIIGLDENGKIQGLLTLALNKENQNIGYAGMHQCEYQVWICRPDDNNIFITKALEVFKQKYPYKKLRLQYLPPGTPIAWAIQAPNNSSCNVEDCPRPIIDLADVKTIVNFLGKKRIRYNYNQLKKYGKFEVRFIENHKDFSSIFDDIASLIDFRRLSAYGFTPFMEDPRKKNYHLAMSKVPGLIFSIMLSVDGQIVAVDVVMIGKGQAHRFFGGVFSPFFAKHSPMPLATYMLAQRLANDKLSILDITPGGGYDSHKWGLANSEDTAYVLDVYPSYHSKMICIVKKYIILLPGKLMRYFSFDKNKVISIVEFIKNRLSCFSYWKYSVKRLYYNGLNYISSTKETKIYCYNIINSKNEEFFGEVKENSLSDLLTYQPEHPWQSKQDFAALCSAYFSQRAIVYTLLINDKLAAMCFVSKEKKQCIKINYKQNYELPENSALIFDLKIFNKDNLITSLEKLLKKISSDIKKEKDIDSLYVAFDCRDNLLIKSVEKIGFLHVESFIEKITLGKAIHYTKF